MDIEKKFSGIAERVLDEKIIRMLAMSLLCIVLNLAIILVIGLLWPETYQYKLEILFSATGIGILVGGYWGARIKARELYPF